MRTIDELVKLVLEQARKTDEVGYNHAEGNIKHSITWHIDDVLKMIKNINDTSLPGVDRTNRIIEFEAKYGVSKTHIL